MPTNPIATCKFYVVRRGREEAIAKPRLCAQEPDTKTFQADEEAQGGKVPKCNRNLEAWIRRVTGERFGAYPVRSH